ncbi:MAG: hypothetical protein HQK53_08385 [Oligoflexia bacterium]|nr:hypothetical protein [Oligoflexia bacterium]
MQTLTSLYCINPTDKEIKNFGYLFAAVFFLILAANYYTTKNISNTSYVFAVVSLGFITVSRLFPRFLVPLYKFWMTIAKVLSWVNMNLILILIFAFLFTPLSIIFHIIRRDPLSLRIDTTINSYFSPMKIAQNYRRQF